MFGLLAGSQVKRNDSFQGREDVLHAHGFVMTGTNAASIDPRALPGNGTPLELFFHYSQWQISVLTFLTCMRKFKQLLLPRLFCSPRGFFGKHLVL